VSSSGHLAVAERLLGIAPPGALTEVVLHGGTLLATLVFFRKEIFALLVDPLSGEDDRRHAARRELARVAVAVVPTVVLAYGIREIYEPLKKNLLLLGAAFLVTTVFLLLSRRAPRVASPGPPLRLGAAFLVGLAQGLAAVPGISRTGSTVSTALLLGADPRRAATFSFLIAIPVILAANVVELASMTSGADPVPVGPLLLGTAVAGSTGYLALHLLLRTLQRGSFSYFGVYTAILGVTLLTCGLAAG
jgi:undecaprenyl-diphosphatase